ncbi:hypothetical protein [Aquicoccus sp. SU-CL01552]|uniref:hypothetical protein n=1 Tax=Aquicoccus sp. SU-CL01552 TaxID=3127656 RepID=UPI00333FA2BE
MLHHLDDERRHTLEIVSTAAGSRKEAGDDSSSIRYLSRLISALTLARAVDGGLLAGSAAAPTTD